ncbi:MAG: hypothetical protein NT161_01120 [Candidatus Nomurabacteria bacterium]|nr:hypothetical protein [Candidatus Nomurabacteria bacterium]
MAKVVEVTKNFVKKNTILPPPQVTVIKTFKKIKSLIEGNKFTEASVALMNNAGDLASEDFKMLNKEISKNFPKNNSTEGNYPTSCGRSMNRRGSGSCRRGI